MARLLFIEDIEETMRFHINSAVRRGIEVDIAGDAESAIHNFENNSYDLVVVDLYLPQSNTGSVDSQGGISLIASLRSGQYGEKNDKVPVIVASAHPFLVDQLDLSEHEILGAYFKLDTLALEDAIKAVC